MTAKSKQSALFPGNEDSVGYWLTPPELMAQLQEEFGFDFDACPYPRPAGFDGIEQTWGASTYVNPPFEGPRHGFTAWARKAIEERNKGHGSVLILPMDRWVQILVEAGAEIRCVGNHEWMRPDGKRRKAPRPSFLFILRAALREEGGVVPTR